MAKEQTAVRERSNTQLKEPRRYKVIMHNDDFTPMDFVVMVLCTIFHKQLPEAEAIMLGIHKTGKAVVGVYSFDMAASKVQKTTLLARDNNYPLSVTLSPED